MKIAVKLVSMHNAGDAPSEKDVAEGATVAEIIDALDLSKDETFAVLVNNMPVAPEDRTKRVLVDGDAMTVFPPIKGG